MRTGSPRDAYKKHTRKIYAIPTYMHEEAIAFLEIWLDMFYEKQSIEAYRITVQRHIPLWRIKYIYLEAFVRPGNAEPMINLFCDDFQTYFIDYLLLKENPTEKESKYVKAMAIGRDDDEDNIEDQIL